MSLYPPYQFSFSLVCLASAQTTVGVYINAASHVDARFWREATPNTATGISQLYVEATEVTPLDVSGLQFSVLLSVVVRLGYLCRLIESWGVGTDCSDLPLAWLRFQLDGGPSMFHEAARALKAQMDISGVTSITVMMRVLETLWGQIRDSLHLRGTLCTIAIDEAQILTSYSHTNDPKVWSLREMREFDGTPLPSSVAHNPTLPHPDLRRRSGRQCPSCATFLQRPARGSWFVALPYPWDCPRGCPPPWARSL